MKGLFRRRLIGAGGGEEEGDEGHTEGGAKD